MKNQNTRLTKISCKFINFVSGNIPFQWEKKRRRRMRSIKFKLIKKYTVFKLIMLDVKVVELLSLTLKELSECECRRDT